MVGARPSFEDRHVLKTFVKLKSKRCGRKKLVRELGLGEGSVRTILKKLKNKGFIASVKQGHTLTPLGEEFIKDFLERFTEPVRLESFDLACGSPKYVTSVHDAAANIKKGLDERDTAVKAGADGAVVMIYKGGELKFPIHDSSMDELSETKRKVSTLDLSEGDVVVISFGKTELSAQDGLYAVVTDLIEFKGV